MSAGLLTGSMAPILPSFVPLGLSHEQTHPLQRAPVAGRSAGHRPVARLVGPAAARAGPAAAGRRAAAASGWRWLERPGAARTGRAAPPAGWSLGWPPSELVAWPPTCGWDAFTHWTASSPCAGRAVRPVARHPAYDWLQGISSVLGLAIVGGTSWPVAAHPPGPDGRAVGPPCASSSSAATAAVALGHRPAVEWRSASARPRAPAAVVDDDPRTPGRAALACPRPRSLGWSVPRTALHPARATSHREPADVP